MPPLQVSKDPKKQAAGRAGAAARNANREKLLNELRVIKAAMREQSDVAVTAASARVIQGKSKEVPSAEPKDVVHHHKHAAVATSFPDDWTSYILAGLVALGIGLAIVVREKSASKISPVATATVSRPQPPAPTPPLVAPHLKPGADPFDMQ